MSNLPIEKAGQQSVAAKPIQSTNDEPVIKVPMKKAVTYMSIIYILFFLDHATRVLINPMFPVIKKELMLTDTQLGFMRR